MNYLSRLCHKTLLSKVMPQDLTKFGLIPEFIGRVPITVSLDLLDIDTLVKILTTPKNALIKQYQKLFEMDDVKLEFEDDAITEIARLAVEQKTGARGLRSILEDAMMDMMYEIPSDSTVGICTISKETIETGKPNIIRRDKIVKEKNKESKKGDTEIA